MYFAKYGSGSEVIVGFHGWSGNHTTFDPLIEYLPAGVTFYSADLPGVGKSPLPTKWDIDEVTSIIAEAVLKETKSKITIIGSCSGGLLSLFVAKYLQEKNDGEKIKRLILIDPFASFPWYFKVFVAKQMGKIGWYAYCSTFANPIGRRLTNMSLKNHRAMETNLTRSFQDSDHRVTYNYLKMLYEAGRSEQFEGLQIPIDIVYGEKTFGAVKKSIRSWKKILTHCREIELKGAGHLPIEEATAQLAAILYQA